MNPLAGFSVEGSIKFSERKSCNTLVTIDLSVTTIPGTMRPAHVHAGSIESAPGAIVISLTPVNGDSGRSLTNVETRDDETVINYSQLTSIDEYVNIHLSPTELATVVAQGNVGINGE